MNAPPVLGMILKGYPRISETFISNEILLLERLGFRLHLFSMRRPRETFTHQSVHRVRARVDYLPETLLRPLPQLLPPNLGLARRRPGAYRCALGLALRRWVRTRRSATFKHLLQAGYLVQRLLPGTGVGHLHAHFAHSPASLALFAGVLSGLPFSFTGHAKDIYTSDPRQLREKIDRARFVVTCTEYNRRHLARLAARPGRSRSTPIHTVYHGIDVDLFDGRDGADAPPPPPHRILTVARMTPKKGLPAVYRALARLRARGLSFEHTLIGDGDQRNELRALIARLGLTGCTRLAGTLPHERVIDHYRRSHAFVLGCEVAANGDRDGIPNVLVESMAMGVPVVATGVSAIPELVSDGCTGRLVAPGRPDLLADALEEVLTDADLRARLIPAARRRVSADFDNRRLIGRLADIYHEHLVLRPLQAPGPSQPFG